MNFGPSDHRYCFSNFDGFITVIFIVLHPEIEMYVNHESLLEKTCHKYVVVCKIGL